MSLQNAIKQIKSKILLSGFIGRTVKLQRYGIGFKGLCPFHNEKTPSFVVSDQKQMYHCFGCGAGGDIIKFVMQSDGLNFAQAINLLAAEAGVAIENIALNGELKEKNKKTYHLLEIAHKWFCGNLLKNDIFLKYLHERNIDDKLIEKFGLGYSGNSNRDLINLLIDRGFKIEDIIVAGLAKYRGGNICAYFYNRLIIPIFNDNNKVVGFGGRTIENIVPKYINSPETEIFQKRNILYGANLIEGKGKRLIVVEGYMDVLAMHKFGFYNVVATMGTSATEIQIMSLFKYAYDEIIFLFDGDSAGRKAVGNIVNNYVVPNLCVNVKILIGFLPQKEDPDNFLRSNGAAAMNTILDSAMNILDFMWGNFIAKIKNFTPEKAALVSSNVKSVVFKIKNKEIAKYYKLFFDNKLYNIVKYSFKKQTVMLPGISSKSPGCSSLLIKIIIDFPCLLKDGIIEEEFSCLFFEEETLRNLRNKILDFCFNENIFDSKALMQKLSQIEGFVALINSLNRTIFVFNNSDEAKSKWADLMLNINMQNLQKEYIVLGEKLKLNPQDNNLQSKLLDLSNKIRLTKRELNLN